MLSMTTILVYYLVLPFVLAALVLKFIRRYGKNDLPDDVQRLWREHPIEKKFFRAVRRDHKGLRMLGDFELHDDAVDCIYAGRKEAANVRERAAFLVLNDKGEALEEVDS